MLSIKRIKIIMFLIFTINISCIFALEPGYKNNNFGKKIKNAHFAEDVFTVHEIILKVPISLDFGSVKNIFITKGGKVLVCYFKGKSILYFDKKGNFIKAIGRQGQGPGEFQRPWYINEIGDKIIVGDFITYRISLFDKNGKFLRSINLHNSISSLSTVADSLFVVNDYIDAKYRKKHDIYVYNLSGSLISKFGELSYAGKELREIPFRPQGPHVISIDNNIFQTDYCDYVIRKYNINGKLIKKFGKKPDGWKSLLTTDYKHLHPGMGMSALDKYWPHFYKCSNVKWISGTDRNLLACISIKITDYGNEKIAIYDTNGNLIHQGLLIKTLYNAAKKDNVTLLPIVGTGFGLWFYPEDSEGMYSEVKDQVVKVKLLIFSLPQKE